MGSILVDRSVNMGNLALNSFIFFCAFLGGKWGLAASKYTMLAAD